MRKSIFDIRKYRSGIFMGYDVGNKSITYHFDPIDKDNIIEDLEKLLKIFKSNGKLTFRDLETAIVCTHDKKVIKK